NVSAGGTSGDVSITGLIGNLVLGNISAGGDLVLQSDVGEISRTSGTTISADTIQWTGQLAAAFEIDSPDVTLITRTPGNVVINYTGSETLILRQVYVLEGSLTVNTPGDLVILDARLLSTSSSYNVQINAGGSVSIDYLSAGDYAATDSQAAQIRAARSLAADAPLTAIGSITVNAGGSIRQQGSGDSLVDVVADTLTLQAGTGISLLNLAANRIISATSAAGSITLTDSDGVGELTPGLLAGTLQAPAGVSLTTAGSLDVTRVSAAANGAAVVLSAGGSLTLSPAAGQSLMLTSGGAITISGTYITWSGTNTASGTVTATAASSVVIPESTFSLSAPGITLTAADDLSLDGSIATSGTNKFTATAGSLAMAADIIARSGATISTLEFSAGKNLSLLEGSFPNVQNRLSITAGRELAQSQTLLNWAATGPSGELIVSAGGNLVLGEAELVQSVLKADARITISSLGYTDDAGISRGGNLAVVSVPSGWSTANTKLLNLFAKNYLHLHESFTASDKLSMRGGQSMITRRAILRNLAGDILADGPDASNILSQLSRSVASISGTKLELAEGTILKLEQLVGSGDQFAADTEIVLTAGDIIVQVEPADPKDGEAESNRNVVAPNTTMAGALTGTGSLVKRGDGVLE
ncbi:MAG: hypothetical protein ACKPJD_11730, partial [Planctomycetaceae bacterium]